MCAIQFNAYAIYFDIKCIFLRSDNINHFRFYYFKHFVKPKITFQNGPIGESDDCVGGLPNVQPSVLRTHGNHMEERPTPFPRKRTRR